MPLAVMLRSVITNLDLRLVLNVYIVDSGIDPGTRSRISASLPERVTLQWLVPERPVFVDLPLWDLSRLWEPPKDDTLFSQLRTFSFRRSARASVLPATANWVSAPTRNISTPESC